MDSSFLTFEDLLQPDPPSPKPDPSTSFDAYMSSTAFDPSLLLPWDPYNPQPFPSEQLSSSSADSPPSFTASSSSHRSGSSFSGASSNGAASPSTSSQTGNANAGTMFAFGGLDGLGDETLAELIKDEPNWTSPLPPAPAISVDTEGPHGFLDSFAFPATSSPTASSAAAASPHDVQLLRDAQQRIFAQLHAASPPLEPALDIPVVPAPSQAAAEKPFKLKKPLQDAVDPVSTAILPVVSAARGSSAVDVLSRAGLPPTSAPGKAMPPIAPKAPPPGTTEGAGTAKNGSSSGSDEGSNAGAGNGGYTGGNGGREKRTHEVQGHNAVEKRYRENINGQIASLRSLVPALRHLSDPSYPSSLALTSYPSHASQPRTAAPSSNTLVDGVYPPSKLSKSLILQKSIEYILALQLARRYLLEDLEGLKDAVKGDVEGGEEVVRRWEEGRRTEEKEGRRRRERERVAREGLAAQHIASPSAANGKSSPAATGSDGSSSSAEEEQKTSTGASKRKPPSLAAHPASAPKQPRLASPPTTANTPSPTGTASSAIDPSLLWRAQGHAVPPPKTMLAVFAGVAFASGMGFDYLSSAPPEAGASPEGAWSIGADAATLPVVARGGAGPLVSGLAFLGAACVVAVAATVLFQPLIDSLRSGKKRARAEEERARRKAALKGLLLLKESEPQDGDGVRMEKVHGKLLEFVGAPTGVASTAVAVVGEAVKVLGGAIGVGAKEARGAEDGAAWVRLLEIECSPSLSFSRLRTLHTFLRVYNLSCSLEAASLAFQQHGKLLGRRRVTALLAIHHLRNAGSVFVASALWKRAGETDELSAAQRKKSDISPEEEDEWTRLAVATPFAEVKQIVLETRQDSTATMPLYRLAEKRYELALVDTWAKIFVAVIRATTASSSSLPLAALSSMPELAKLAGTSCGAAPELVGEAIELIQRAVSRILASTMQGTEVHSLAMVTAGVWCTAFGGEQTASYNLAKALVVEARGDGPAKRSKSAKLFLALVAGEQSPWLAEFADTRQEGAVSEVERLAEAALEWLLVARRFAALTSTEKKSSVVDPALQESTLHLRRLLAHPVFRSPSVVGASVGEPPEQRKARGLEREFDIADAVDLCVEALTVMGRRCAGLKEDDDSGYESA